MGLDWNPLSRPRPGREAEYAQVFRRIQAAPESEAERLLAWFQEVSQPPFEVLGAPRVGQDAAADAWLREHLAAEKSFDEARAALHGYYVLDLLPECDGFPYYTHHGLYEGVDRYSFRAQFLKDVEDVLGPELMERAYQTLLPDELREYGADLLQKAREFASARGVQHVEHAKPEYDEESDESRAHILFAAAKWCLYWAERGFGLEPWF